MLYYLKILGGHAVSRQQIEKSALSIGGPIDFFKDIFGGMGYIFGCNFDSN